MYCICIDFVFEEGRVLEWATVKVLKVLNTDVQKIYIMQANIMNAKGCFKMTKVGNLLAEEQQPAVAFAIEHAVKQVREEAAQERQQEHVKNARILLQHNTDLEVIKEVTGLSEEEIKKL